jgi:pimeloyl-ACP methyl ester carboxylesterase
LARGSTRPVSRGEAAFGTLIGPGFLDHFVDLTADDLPANIRGLRAFLRSCLGKPVPAEDFETALCWNMAVAPRVRAGLGVPLLVTQGRSDTVVLPAMAEHILATCPAAEASWYDGVGHVPHLEEPGRFNRELAALTRRVLG